jgi:hypothetical protein
MGGVVIPTPTDGGNGGAGGGSAASSGTAGVAAAGMGGRFVMDDCASSKATATDLMTVRPADIIFAVDSSSSMMAEIEAVRMNLNAFSSQIVAAGVDARVIMIGDSQSICIDAPLGSGQCPMDEKLPGYAHVPARVGSEDALDQILGTYAQWSQHLRPNATKSFVVVTDDDATRGMTNTAAAFTSALTALDPVLFAQWSFNGVFCFTQCMQAAAVGTVYSALVTQTMGVSGDLCLQDFQPVFDRLAKQIIEVSGAEIACEWPLPPVPSGQSFAGELVAVTRTTSASSSPLARVLSEAECTQGGWFLDDPLNPTKIRACPNTCAEMQNQSGGQIDVVFGCEAVASCVASDEASVATGTQTTCEWDLPPPPRGQLLDLTTVNVRYTSPSGFASNLGNVPTGAECAMFQQGWYYDDPLKPKKIIACPQTCTAVQSAGASAKVDVLFGCKTKPAEPVP